MFALALHSRRESEKKANEKRRQSTVAATSGRMNLQRRISQMTLDEVAQKSAQHQSRSESPSVSNGDHQLPNGDQAQARIKARSYSAITVIRTKAPEEVLSAAGVTLVGTKPNDQQKDQTDAGESDASSPKAILLRESGPRVVLVRMSHDQHRATAARLKRQMTQPALCVHQIPELDETAERKAHQPLEKQLSK